MFFCGIFTGIPAIFLGATALRDIAASNGRIDGRGMARAGLILGIVGIVLWLLGLAVGRMCTMPKSFSRSSGRT
jgi:hypothetical protein